MQKSKSRFVGSHVEIWHSVVVPAYKHQWPRCSQEVSLFQCEVQH